VGGQIPARVAVDDPAEEGHGDPHHDCQAINGDHTRQRPTLAGRNPQAEHTQRCDPQQPDDPRKRRREWPR
jgi:hypothetical protein